MCLCFPNVVRSSKMCRLRMIARWCLWYLISAALGASLSSVWADEEEEQAGDERQGRVEDGAGEGGGRWAVALLLITHRSGSST